MIENTIRIRLWPEKKAEFFLIKTALNYLGREENIDDCIVSKTVTVLSTGVVGILQADLILWLLQWASCPVAGVGGKEPGENEHTL